jgi:uncharacterized phage protein (TIGR02218 family)
MKASISPQLDAHFGRSSTTVASCVRFTRTDLNVYTFTGLDRKLKIAGVDYLPRIDAPSATAAKLGLSVDQLDVSGVIDSVLVTDDDLIAGRWHFAAVDLFEVNYADLSQGIHTIGAYVLGRVRMEGPAYRAEVLGLTHLLQQRIGRMLTPTCEWNVFDANCGVDVNTFPNAKHTGAVTQVDTIWQFRDSSISQATGWFDGGRLTWLDGPNAGLSMEVKSQDATLDTVMLRQAMPFQMANGDNYEMTAGCDKTRPTCRDKYNNRRRYGGAAELPGSDRIFSGQ